MAHASCWHSQAGMKGGCHPCFWHFTHLCWKGWTAGMWLIRMLSFSLAFPGWKLQPQVWCLSNQLLETLKCQSLRLLRKRCVYFRVLLDCGRVWMWHFVWMGVCFLCDPETDDEVILFSLASESHHGRSLLVYQERKEGRVKNNAVCCCSTEGKNEFVWGVSHTHTHTHTHTHAHRVTELLRKTKHMSAVFNFPTKLLKKLILSS